MPMISGVRLLPEPPRQLVSYTPHAPATPVDARIVSVYGNAVQFAAPRTRFDSDLGAVCPKRRRQIGSHLAPLAR